MYRNCRSVALTALCLCPLLIALPSAEAAEHIEKQLKSEYQGKVLTLRHFYTGACLRFAADGSTIPQAPVGSWTVDGQLRVQSIQLRGRILKIEGRRRFMFFDSESHQLRDLTSLRKDERAATQFTKPGDRDWKKALAAQQRVDIEIELVSESPDSKEITPVIDAIFLAPKESLGDIAPSFWRNYFKRQEGQADDGESPYAPVYRANLDGILAPRLLYAPDPEYAEEARKAGYQGTVMMSFVVDKAGIPKNIQITKPAGLGLDEKSVEAVSAWKFEPGQKEAGPVSVELEVETSFRLY